MTLASETSRYLFDLDFDAEHRKKDEAEAIPTITVYEHEAQMAALERRVRAEAHAAGRQEALDEGALALANETKNLTDVTSNMISKLDTEIGIREERAVRIAVTAAKKLARRLLQAEPQGEVEQLFRSCLAPMFDASHLVVRMSEEHVDDIRKRLEGIATAQGFEGRLVFLGEEGFDPGDARIEWADGGLSRSQNEIEQAMDQLISSYLSARNGASDPAESASPAPNSPESEALLASMEGASS